MTPESLYMLNAFVFGIYITFVYDLLRIFRRVISHSLFWISAEDLLFWGYCAVEVFLLMYHLSDGTLRWFAVLGALAGMLLYHKTVSSFLVKYLSLFFGRMVSLLRSFLRAVFGPVGRAMSSAVSGVSSGMVSGRKRIRLFLKNRLTHLKKVLKILVYKL